MQCMDVFGVKIEHLDVHAFDLHTTPLQARTMNGEASGATNVFVARKFNGSPCFMLTNYTLGTKHNGWACFK